MHYLLFLFFVNINSQVVWSVSYINRLSNVAINVWFQNSIKFKFSSLINILVLYLKSGVEKSSYSKKIIQIEYIYFCVFYNTFLYKKMHVVKMAY